MSTPLPPRMDRRTALKWVLTAAASTAFIERGLPSLRAATPASAGANAVTPVTANGYGTDPDLVKDYKPGDVWPLTLTDDQRRTAAALCGLILPADGDNPSAAALGVHDFIDEWISAPYPAQRGDRVAILTGLAWIEAEARKRFAKGFADLSEAQMSAIADEICYEPRARPEHKEPARFFAIYRNLTAGGYFSTPLGMAQVGYVGNTPLVTFDGPPPEVLRKLGLA